MMTWAANCRGGVHVWGTVSVAEVLPASVVALVLPGMRGSEPNEPGPGGVDAPATRHRDTRQASV